MGCINRSIAVITVTFLNFSLILWHGESRSTTIILTVQHTFEQDSLVQLQIEKMNQDGVSQFSIDIVQHTYDHHPGLTFLLPDF